MIDGGTMKTAAFSIFVALSSIAASQPNDYQRRGLSLDAQPAGPKPIVSELYLRDCPPGSEQFEMAYKNFMDARPEFGITSLTISQTLNEGAFLVTTAGGADRVLLYPDHEAPDGTTLSIPVQPTGKTHDFITVLGARRRLAVIEAKQDRFSRDEFLALIKRGHTFTITKTAPATPCNTCSGAGRIPIKAGKRTGDGKSACEPCRGSGKIAAVYQKKVRWQATPKPPDSQL